VVDRTAEGEAIADTLPNRFGGLLHRLNLEVLRQAAPDRSDAYARAHRSAIGQGRWAGACWPALIASDPADPPRADA
jgi:hypothetical protein